jgi:hypothetical protein
MGHPGSPFYSRVNTISGIIDARYWKEEMIPEGWATRPNGANGRAPQNGEVAYNPRNFGLTDKAGRAAANVDKGANPLIFQPDWDTAQIRGVGKNAGKTIQPSATMPQVPDGLPVDTDQSLPGTDIIGGVKRNSRVNRIDLYRYDDQGDAEASTRRVKVTVYIPVGSKAHCPSWATWEQNGSLSS